MKVLFLATYGDFLSTFEYSNIALLVKLGNEVHCVADFEASEYNLKTSRLDSLGVVRHQIKFSRSPMDLSNFHAMRSLMKLMKHEKFDVLDCHNAVVSVFGRIVAKLSHVPYVIYTAHGFFFYRGSSLKTQLVFRPIESFLSRYTDLLITINHEDFEAASRMHIRGKALYVPGIGIDSKAIRQLPNERNNYLSEFNLKQNTKIFLMVGELIQRKNQETAIRAFAAANLVNSVLLICGIGAERGRYNDLIRELKMQDRILLIGYRQDVKSLMRSSDLFIFPSIQEGLPVALMEAMASGLPCIASNIRGNNDLIDDQLGGWLFDCNDVEQLSTLMSTASEADLKKFGMYNQRKICEFDQSNVSAIMEQEYKTIQKQIVERGSK